MRVLVAGATSVLGMPVLRALADRGHTVIGVTRSPQSASAIARAGAKPVVADVLQRHELSRTIAAERPEAVVSLLITLPKRGPMWVRDFRRTRRLWSEGVPNLLQAATAAGVRRFVAESVIFAYGFGQSGPEPVEEAQPAELGGVVRGQQGIIDDLRAMERAVLRAGDAGVEAVVLRYGLFHGTGVPSSELMARMLRLRMLSLPGGGRGILSWIEIGDAVNATVAALERGPADEIYNIVDEEPVGYGDYAREFATALGARAPLSIPVWLARRTVPHAATMLSYTRLPVSNQKAKRELDWAPACATYRDAIRQFASSRAGG